MLNKAGRTAEAEKIFAEQRAKAKAPQDFNSLCWSKAIADVQLDSALADCREAVRRSPDAGPYQDSLGMVLLKLGRIDESLAAYEKAVAKGTGAASFMGRAIAHARKGQMALARADVAEARKLDADIEARFADYGLKIDDQGRAIKN